jgi:hypothetical protein
MFSLTYKIHKVRVFESLLANIPPHLSMPFPIVPESVGKICASGSHFGPEAIGQNMDGAKVNSCPHLLPSAKCLNKRELIWIFEQIDLCANPHGPQSPHSAQFPA